MQLLTASWERCDALSRQSVAMARRLSDLPTLASVLVEHLWTVANGHARSLDERRALIAEILTLAEQTGDPTVALYAYWFQMVVALEAGDAVAAEQAIASYDALAHRFRTMYAMERALQLKATREMLVGRLAAAEDLIGQAAALTERMHSPGAVRKVTSQLRYLYLYQGRAGELAAFYQGQAGELATGLQEILRVAAAAAAMLQRHVQVWRAYIFARAGHLEAARAEFEQVAGCDFADLHRCYDEVIDLAHLAETCALLGDARRATLLYRRLLPLRTQGVASAIGDTFHGAVAHYLGLLAAALLRAGCPMPGTAVAGEPAVDEPAAAVDWETAVDHFEAALTFHTRIGARM